MALEYLLIEASHEFLVKQISEVLHEYGAKLVLLDNTR